MLRSSDREVNRTPRDNAIDSLTLTHLFVSISSCFISTTSDNVVGRTLTREFFVLQGSKRRTTCQDYVSILCVELGMETAGRRFIESELASVAAAHAAVVALASAEFLREEYDTEQGRGVYLTALAQNAVDHALAGDDGVAFSLSIQVIALGKSLGIELPPPTNRIAHEHLRTIAQYVAQHDVVWNLSAHEDIMQDGNQTRERVVERVEASMDAQSCNRFDDLTALACKTFGTAWSVILDRGIAPAKTEIIALHDRIGTDSAFRRIAANAEAAC